MAWLVTFGELYAVVGLLLGLTTRWVAAVGGYYDASLLAFFISNIVFLSWPSGQWLGLDRVRPKRAAKN